jgi:hypothetical protein
MKRHKVTRKTKSGKSVTYMRGKDCGSSKGSEFKAKRHAKIMSMYDEAGVSRPVGKGEHTVEFHKRATDIMAGMKKSDKGVNKNLAYAIAMKQLGRNKSVLKSHQR